MVTYPEGATFHVKVDNPDIVLSHQWYVSDSVGKEFKLDGSSATTDTLIVPSTEWSKSGLMFRCVIEDNQGHTTYTDPAYLTLANEEEDKTVLFIGEYALEPGDSLNLEDAALGEGTV